MKLTYEEKKQRETLRNDEKRYELCLNHTDVLKLIYFVGDRLMSAPLLVDFLCISDAEMNYHKAQKIIARLVKEDVLQQEYISLSYNPARTRILYLSKYATAHLLGAPNTIGADVLNRKHLSPQKIEKRVLRAQMIYDRFKMFTTEHSIDDLLKFWRTNASSYAFRQNQYAAYFLKIVKVIKPMPVETVNRHDASVYFAALDKAEKIRKEALKKGQESKNNKAGVLHVKPQKELARKRKKNEKATIQKVLANMDIASIVWDGERLTIDVDYVATEDKADYKKILKNLVVMYKLFAKFVSASILHFDIKFMFTSELQLARFNASLHKEDDNNERQFIIDLAESGVLYGDALKISVRGLK